MPERKQVRVLINLQVKGGRVASLASDPESDAEYELAFVSGPESVAEYELAFASAVESEPAYGAAVAVADCSAAANDRAADCS